jgi:hypothetical protein
MWRGRNLIALLAALAGIEYLIYFQHAGHFFQADTLYWFDHRLTTLTEFVRSFAAPDPGGWYRPLTNRTIQSLLYPAVGLNPPAYRCVQFLLFFADIVAVFALTSQLTRRPIAPLIAAVFFTLHTINAYTTYDLAFVPELTYTLFYIGSVLAFLRFLETKQRSLLLVSSVAFALSLCSKESAVTLPAAACVMAYLQGRKVKPILRSVIPLAAILVAYLMFTLGYLKIASEALASLRTPPTEFEAGGYYFMAGPHVLTNALTAWSWGLNLPVGLLGEWRDQTTLRSIVIWGFAALQMAVLAYAVRTEAWRPVIAGFAWFWISVLPALPLRGHFLPYYLLLPIVGFSLMVGASWAQLYDRIATTRARPAVAMASMTFILLALVLSRTSRSEARNNFLLGRSSRIAETSLRDIRNLFPSISPGTRFWIQDESEPDLNFHQAEGGLFRVAYGDSSLQFAYSNTNSPAPLGTLPLIYKQGHLQKGAE